MSDQAEVKAGSVEPAAQDQDAADLGTEHSSGLVNIGADTVARHTEHLPEDQRLVVRWLHHHARERRLQWADLARLTQISTTTLYRVWHDKYRDKEKKRVDLAGLCERIARYKRLVEKRDAVTSADFVETSVWDRVSWICEKALTRQKIGFVYGESQIGKTCCLQEYQRRNNHGQTTYCEIPPGGGIQLMAKCLAKALHVSYQTSFDRMTDDILDAVDPSRMLIFDEVHRIFTVYQRTSVMRCWDFIRYIYDQTGCGIVLSGTNVFRDGLREGEFMQYLKQLRRRGLYEVQLPAVPPRGDLDMMAKRFGLEPAEDKAEEIMLALAKTHGFGMYITRLQDASEIAHKKREELAWTHFVKAVSIVERMSKEAE